MANMIVVDSPRSAKVSFSCDGCAETQVKFRSQARPTKSGQHFCGGACYQYQTLHDVPCCWPGCDVFLKARRSVQTNRGKKVIQWKTDLRRGGLYRQFPLCEAHGELIARRLDRGARLSNGRLRLLANPNHEYDSRVLGSRFLRLVVFERARGRCEGCDQAQDWRAPPRTWEVDHRIPVFRGGKTKLDNLQMLCLSCHNVKTNAEKSEAAKARWAGCHERSTRWMTHYEKNLLIARLQGEVDALRKQVGERKVA
jgi:hypothetical protein